MNDEMGPFLIEGYIEIFGQHKLREKVMATQNMRRLKFAKFKLTKKYTSKSIEVLVEEKREIKRRERSDLQR